jgi:hypothetical protein
MDYEHVIDTYNDLRENCLKIARSKPEYLGEYGWLRYAILESDITLFLCPGFIECNGVCYTSQTMCHESFSFRIPINEIRPL